MPSPNLYSSVETGPGRIHVDVVSAAAELFNSSTSAVVASFAAVLSQTLAKPTYKQYTAAGGGDASLVIPAGDGPFWVGDNVSEDLKNLFTVVDQTTDQQIFNTHTRLYVSVASISATVGSGFTSAASSITLTFNTPVPANLQYKVYYGRRATLGVLPVELAVNPMIRRSVDRVRFPEFDRLTYAPTSITNDINYTGVDGYPDPYLAQWKAISKGSLGTLDTGRSGAMGYVHISTKKNINDSQDAALRNQSAAAFFAAVEKEIQSNALLGNTPYTKVNSALTAVVQNNNEVVLNALDYFRLTGPHRTAFRLGMDMLEITFASGYKGVYLPISFDASDPRLVRIVTLGGNNPALGNDANVRVKWVRTTFFTGASENTVSAFELKGQGSLVAGAITDNPSAEIPQTAPFFMAGTLDPARADSANGNWNIKSLCWGSFAETAGNTFALGLKTLKGELWGDGSIQSYGGRIVGFHTARGRSVGVAANTADDLNPHSASQIRYDFTLTTAKVLTLTIASAYTPQEGDQIIIYIWHIGTGVSRTGSSVSWPASWKFSGTDGDIAVTSPNGVQAVIKYVGTYANTYCFFTRTDFEV